MEAIRNEIKQINFKLVDNSASDANDLEETEIEVNIGFSVESDPREEDYSTDYTSQNDEFYSAKDCSLFSGSNVSDDTLHSSDSGDLQFDDISECNQCHFKCRQFQMEPVNLRQVDTVSNLWRYNTSPVYKSKSKIVKTQEELRRSFFKEIVSPENDDDYPKLPHISQVLLKKDVAMENAVGNHTEMYDVAKNSNVSTQDPKGGDADDVITRIGKISETDNCSCNLNIINEHSKEMRTSKRSISKLAAILTDKSEPEENFGTDHALLKCETRRSNNSIGKTCGTVQTKKEIKDETVVNDKNDDLNVKINICEGNNKETVIDLTLIDANAEIIYNKVNIGDSIDLLNEIPYTKTSIRKISVINAKDIDDALLNNCKNEFNLDKDSNKEVRNSKRSVRKISGILQPKVDFDGNLNSSDKCDHGFLNNEIRQSKKSSRKNSGTLETKEDSKDINLVTDRDTVKDKCLDEDLNAKKDSQINLEIRGSKRMIKKISGLIKDNQLEDGKVETQNERNKCNEYKPIPSVRIKSRKNSKRHVSQISASAKTNFNSDPQQDIEVDSLETKLHASPSDQSLQRYIASLEDELEKSTEYEVECLAEDKNQYYARFPKITEVLHKSPDVYLSGNDEKDRSLGENHENLPQIRENDISSTKINNLDDKDRNCDKIVNGSFKKYNNDIKNDKNAKSKESGSQKRKEKKMNDNRDSKEECNSLASYSSDKHRQREVAAMNILNAFLNLSQRSVDDSKEDLESGKGSEDSFGAVASVTTCVMDADKVWTSSIERCCRSDSFEQDSLESTSYVSTGRASSQPCLRTCGKCRRDLFLDNQADSLVKNHNRFKNQQLASSADDSRPDKEAFRSQERGRGVTNHVLQTGGAQGASTSDSIDTSSRTSDMATIPLDIIPAPHQKKHHTHNDELTNDPNNYTWKRLLAQILAVSAKNTLAFNFGMSVGFQTIAIPSLGKPNSDLHLEQNQISLFGSLFFTAIPIGCLMSGPTIHGWGRKPAMLVFCFPLFIAWWIYYFANSPAFLYAAILILGLVNGLLEAPVLTYVAEISEAKWRGSLASSSIVSSLLGIFQQMVLGNLFSWRTTAAINSAFPIISFICICFIPESPHWLAGKGREEDVEKSLMWLRGWTDAASVAEEKKSLMEAHRHPRVATTPLSWSSYNSRTFIEPFLIVIGSFAIGHFSGQATVQTYSVSIFESLGVQGWKWTAGMGASQVLGATTSVIALPIVGKRPVAVASMVGVAIGMAGAALASTHFAAAALLLANFSTNSCSRVMPWVLIGEVFTNEMRAVASGMTSCICYVMAFALSYTYLNVVAALGIRVVLGIYGAVGLVGVIAYYLFLPETENKTLEEVQEYFASRATKTGVDNQAFEQDKP